MNFPAYVPAAVREHLTHYLEGESDRDIPGYIELLAKAETALAENKRADDLMHRDMLASDVDCLRRLGHDPRMRDAFTLIAREYDGDQQLRSFIHSAWAARMDNKYYRERLKRVQKLWDKIAETSEELARLLRDISNVGSSYWPSELFSIPELLRKTDNHDMRDHNLQMWRSMRPHVLGDPPRRDIPESEPKQETGEPPSAPEIVRIILIPLERSEIDPEEEQRNTLRYAWGTAPDVSALLDTVAMAAREFKPNESGIIGAAIVSRQQSTKTEYLRAFGNLLTDAHHLTLTPGVMKAMAIVANVAINLPDVDVTYDDVRKSLVNRNGETLENSGGK